MTKRVLVSENHHCFREGLSLVLDREPGLEVIGQVRSLHAEDLSSIALGGADAVILGLGPLDGDALELIRELYEEATPPVPVLVLALSADPTWHARALEAGAEEVLTKNASLEDIIASVVLLGFEPSALALAP